MKKLNLKSEIKNLWAKIKTSRDCDPGKASSNPFRDWRRLVSVWMVLLFLVLGVSAYLSQWINNLEVSLSSEEIAATVQINPKLVTKAKQIIEGRALRFEQNRQTPPVSIDPSL